MRNGQQSAVALDAIALMDALKIDKATLAGFDWGARAADIVAALWLERCKALVSVSGYLIASQEAGKEPLPPTAEVQWWYQFYFATERVLVGYDKNRRNFSKLIWRQASPKWDFDDATFDRSSTAFDDPDPVAIVIHNYRWWLWKRNSPRGPSSQYPRSLWKATPMVSEAELLAFGETVNRVAADDCHLFLWTTQRFLPLAFRLIDAWALRYSFVMDWRKMHGMQPLGLPQFNLEHVVYARKGSPRFVDTKAFACCFDRKHREHSRKPNEFYDTARRVTAGPRLDMFSCERRPGFDQRGNEADKFGEAAE
jgi:N6-adenosine-specific RNA methylase IME4